MVTVKVTPREYEELKQLRTLVDEVLDGRQEANRESAERWYHRAVSVRHVGLGSPVRVHHA